MSSAREMDKNKSQRVRWEGAPRGMIKNAPQDDLPNGSVASVTNAICHNTEWRPRLGTRIRSCPSPPALSGRTGYRAYKKGQTIYTFEDVFSQGDVSHFWVWPDVSGKPQHDEIQQYVNARQVRTGTSGDINITSGCWMHARLNLWEWHYKRERFVFQWGTGVYVAEFDDDSNIVNRVHCVCRSVDHPSNVNSDWDEDGDYGIIFNSGGMFVLDFDHQEICKRNTPSPQVLLSGNLRTNDRTYRYPYTYAMARIEGHGLRDRTTPGAQILQQSGSIQTQMVDQEQRDYTDKWTEKPIGDSTYTTGILVGKAIDEAYRDPNWWTQLADPGASFKATINEIDAEFQVDFGPAGEDIHSMGEVAEVIQKQLRTVFFHATCKWDVDHFEVSAGNINGLTIDYFDEGTSGTDIAAVMELRIEDNPTLNNSYQYQADHEVSIFNIPYQEYSAGKTKSVRERHWTHYVVCRGPDQGLYGVKPRVDEFSGAVLAPVDIGWICDARVAGAFWASKDEDGLITAIHGEFERKDEGTPFEWEDGEVDIVGIYVDSKHVYARGGGYYYEEEKGPMAAAIGGGRVVRGYQTGDRVYRTGFGDNFSSLTRGETLWTSDLRELVILEVISDTEVRVDQSQDRTTMGFTCCPAQRVVNDITPDETLLNRAGEKFVGLWEYRWYTHMPSGGVGKVVPGFTITAKQNDSQINYCDLGIYTRYMMGYHLPNRQVIDRIQGAIQAIRKTPNKFVVWCKNSTWGGPTNISDSNIKRIPELGTAYAILYVDILNDRIGVVDTGSIAPVADGVFEMRCQDGSWRQFDGTKYSEDLTMDPETRQDRIKKDLGDTWPLSASIYSDKENLGHILWEKLKP